MSRALPFVGATAFAATTALVATAVMSAPALAAATVTTRVANPVVTPTTVVKGKGISVSGQAQRYVKTWSSAPGATAVIYFDADGSAPNSAQRTLKADAKGNFSASFTPATSGYWSVQLPATTTNKMAVSGRVYVKVTTPAATTTASATSMPKGSVNCPSWAPIKGNSSSHIFHMPGQRYYVQTHPEMCFSTPAAAVKAGYRAAKI